MSTTNVDQIPQPNLALHSSDQAVVERAVTPYKPMAAWPPISLDQQEFLLSTFPVTTESASTGIISAAQPQTKYRVRPHRCSSPFCSYCHAGLTAQRWENWGPVLRSFGNILMMTFTVDRTLFEDAYGAYMYLKEKRCLAVTMQSLKRLSNKQAKPWLLTDRYCWALEFQQGGWAHYHVLIDAKYIPFQDLVDVWSKHRPPEAPPPAPGRPGFGFVWIDHSRVQGSWGPETAFRYITKWPDCGYPDWVLRETRMNVHGTSRGFLPPAPVKRSTRKKKPVIKPRKKRAPNRTYAERMEECNTKTHLFKEVVEKNSMGVVEVNSIWQGELDCSTAEFYQAVDQGPYGVTFGYVLGGSVDELKQQVEAYRGGPVEVRLPPPPGQALPPPSRGEAGESL